MPKGTRLICRSCRAINYAPVTFTNVGTFGGALIAIRCWSCGRVVKGGTQSGVYSTGPGGRLQRVRVLAAALASDAPADAEQLAQRIETANAGLEPLAAWVRRNKSELLVSSLRDIVVMILTVLVTQALAPEPPPPGITKGQMEQLIEELQQPPEAEPHDSHEDKGGPP